MEINADLLRVINNNFKAPAIILDQYGEILTFNENARKIFSSNSTLNSFWTLFSTDSISIIKKSFKDSISLSKSITERAVLLTGEGGKQDVDITFSGLGENGDRIILCTFDMDVSRTEKLKLTIKPDEISEIIKSELFLSILEEIRSSFPFTLLGKGKIRNEINKLDEFFWIKDPEGKYLLVNNKFAKNLGLKPIQVEGKYEKEFIPKYLSGFFDALDEFMQSTTHAVIREGLIQPISTEYRNLRIIEIPLCDLDNRTIAIIGFAQETQVTDKQEEDTNYCLESLIKALDSPLAIFNNTGELLFSNKLFEEFQAGLTIKEKTEIVQDMKTQVPGLSSSAEPGVLLKKTLGKEKLSFVFNLRKLYNNHDDFNRLLLHVYPDKQNSSEILLNDREKMYEILMQASPEPMYIYDIENLRFLEVNKAALDIYGYSRNEFLQMDLTDLYAPEDIQTLLDSDSSRNKESVFTGPWRHKKRDGTALLVEISKVSFEFQDAKAHFNLIRDVTDKIEMKKELQLYKNIFDNTSEMIFTTDTEGFITFANNSVLDNLGYERGELDTRPIITLVADTFRAQLSNLYYSGGEVTSLTDIEFKKKNGSTLILNVLCTPVFDYNEQVISYNIIAKPSEKQIVVQEPASEKVISPSPDVKVSSSAIDSTLLSSMFHEILTPINVILGFVQEITENISSPSEEIKEASEIINQNRQILLQTMDAVLEYSHIEQKRIELNPEKVLFTEILEKIQKNTKKTAESNKIEFSYGKISSSLSIETDVHRMESLLSMFITAAMRITKEKTIFISAYQYDELNYIISIKDNRRSISEYLSDTLSQIFSDPKHEIKKDYGISKLSINLARKLSKLLNGRFETIRKQGELSESGFIFPFSFSFVKTESEQKELKDEIKIKQVEKIAAEPPLFESSVMEPKASVPEIQEIIPVRETVKEIPSITERTVSVQDKPQKQDGRIDLHSLKCLYVEDQIDSQILFKVQMKELKHIDFAVSFEAALPLLEQNRYDFIIMDINLQGEYNGLDALRIIRRLPGYDRTKIIAVTAYVLPGDKEKFVAAGFNDFISKPILREKLIDSLNKVLL